MEASRSLWLIPVLCAQALVRCLHAGPVDLGHVEQCRFDPEICAFLDTIAYAEGTFIFPGALSSGPFNADSYKYIFGFGQFDGFGDHPRCVVCLPCSGTIICSSAAGRYQFSQNMWDRMGERMGIKDFSPTNQDRAAIYLLVESGAVGSLKQGRFHEALQNVRRIWASMPGAPYNQPTKKGSDLYAFYVKRRAYHARHRVRRRGADVSISKGNQSGAAVKRGRLWKA